MVVTTPSSSSLCTLKKVLVLVACLLHCISEARSMSLANHPQCHPSVVQSMKPRVRQICKALEAIWEFSDAMEIYLNEKESGDFFGGRELPPLVPESAESAEAAEVPRMLSGVKRKGDDVDHVFLRFGKRNNANANSNDHGF